MLIGFLLGSWLWCQGSEPFAPGTVLLLFFILATCHFLFYLHSGEIFFAPESPSMWDLVSQTNLDGGEVLATIPYFVRKCVGVHVAGWCALVSFA